MPACPVAPRFPAPFRAAADAVARVVVRVFDGGFADVPDIAAVVLRVPIEGVLEQHATPAVAAADRPHAVDDHACRETGVMRRGSRALRRVCDHDSVTWHSPSSSPWQHRARARLQGPPWIVDDQRRVEIRRSRSAAATAWWRPPSMDGGPRRSNPSVRSWLLSRWGEASLGPRLLADGERGVKRLCAHPPASAHVSSP